MHCGNKPTLRNEAPQLIKKGKQMSVENVTTAPQVYATTGEGFPFFLPEPRLVTFRIVGDGSIEEGAITIECCAGNAPRTELPQLASQPAWTALTTIAVPANATTEYGAGSVSGTFRARIRSHGFRNPLIQPVRG